MPNQVIDHVHSFVRWKKNFGEINFKCQDPDCYEIKPISLLVGKRSLCAICHLNEIILTKEDLRRARPRCPDCSNTEEAKRKRRVRGTVTDILKDLGVSEP